MKINPKIIARCEPILKTDGQGKTWIVGYRRKKRSNNHKDYWLKQPKLVQ